VPDQPAVTGGRLPALDGVRALAVALVIAYHGGLPGLQVAGFYGVDIFFVLSGFLITRLLLDEQAQRGRIGLAMFWGRRAKRLLPGLLVMLAAVEAYVVYASPQGRYPAFRGDALSVLAYSSNWHFIHQSSNYFSATGAPSLLTHTWSLAIEEQFYLVWPLLVLGAVWLARRTRRNAASLVLAVSAVGSVASAGWMAALYRSGTSPSRLYYGTDTHVQSILVGCALAALMTLTRMRVRRPLATVAAALVACGLGWAGCTLGSSDPIAYEGGFLAVSLFTAILVAVVVTTPSSNAARLLSLPPLVYIGTISYGMYLWYFPLFEVIDRANTGLAGANLFLVRVAADVAVAAVSFHLLEQPIRQWKPRLRLRLPAGVGPLLAGAATAVAVGALVVAGTPAAYTVSSAGSSLAASVASSAAAVVHTDAAAGGRGMRVLVFGDSTAATLGDDLVFSREAEQHRIVVDVVGIFGCGLVMSAAVDIQGQSGVPPAPCRVASPPDERWPAVLRAAIRAFHPAVVLVASGRWEVDSRRSVPGGPWVNITDAGDAAGVRSALEVAASVVVGSGARLALATAPCFASGEQPNGDPWPQDSPTRLDAYNSLVRQVAAAAAGAHPRAATVVDLDSMVCPGRAFHRMVDGVVVRAPDGIHYPFFDFKRPNDPAPDTLAEAKAFGAWIGPRILDQFSSVAG
jgi:peptidoglycan/LPS O-acetylase OafA/YrhL